MVCGRRDKSLSQRGRSASSAAGESTGSPLHLDGGRRGAVIHLSGALPGGLSVFCGLEIAGTAARRPGGYLSSNDSRSRVCHVVLRPARTRALRGFCRLRSGQSGDPDCGRRSQAGDYGGCRLAGRKSSAVETNGRRGDFLGKLSARARFGVSSAYRRRNDCPSRSRH